MRSKPSWEWYSLNNHIEQYDAVYCFFRASKYDMFFLASVPNIAPILFLDQDGFDYFVEHKDPYDSHLNAYYPQTIDMIRPYHNDTWYFVFMNGYEEGGIDLNVSIRFTPNYYGYPLTPNPKPEPTPNPIPLNIGVIIICVGIAVVIGVVGTVILLRRKRLVFNKE